MGEYALPSYSARATVDASNVTTIHADDAHGPLVPLGLRPAGPAAGGFSLDIN